MQEKTQKNTLYDHYNAQYNNNLISFSTENYTPYALNEKIPHPFLERKKPFIPCFKHNKKYQLNTKEIHYAHCNISGVHLVTEDGEYHTHLTLKKISELSELMYCHRSRLVNYAYIKRIEYLENGCGEAYTYNDSDKPIPISRKHMKEMTKNW